MRVIRGSSGGWPTWRGLRCLAAPAAVLLGCAATTSAQWVEQTVALEAGWNSVYLTVDPVPSDPDLLFSGLPLLGVWSPARETVGQPPDCVDPNDPACVPRPSDGWRVWLPPGDPARAVVNTLRLVRGGRAYFIQSAAPAALHVVGTPNGAKTRWVQGFNLEGFHVVTEPQATPTFQAYLAASPVHASTVVFGLSTGGALLPVTDLAQTLIAPGRAYWVKCSQDAEYDGPLSVDSSSLRGIDYALTVREHQITLTNLSASARAATVTYAASAAVPPGVGLSALVSDVPVLWLDYGAGDVVSEVYQWRPLQSQTWSLTAAGTGGARHAVRLAVNRASLEPATLRPDRSGSQYAGVLRVTDGAGYERVLPVAAQVGNPAGLWVGHVTVNGVSWVTAPSSGEPDADTPRPTPAEFTFPVILHRSEGDPAVIKLLTEVTIMWQPGSAGDPGDPGDDVLGRYVLVTPEAPPGLVEQLEPGSNRDGQPFSPRFSTAAFCMTDTDTNGVPDDLVLTGSFDSALEGSVTIGFEHPLNPFRHPYHPDHDGLTSWLGGQPAPGEVYEVTRAFTFTFLASPLPGWVSSGLGESYLGGTYTESVAGLHRDAIHAAGVFELHRVSTVGKLNDQ